MIRVIAPQNQSGADYLKQWAVSKLPFPIDLGLCEPLAVTDGNKLLAVAVYHNYRVKPKGAAIEVSFATDGPGWATRSVLRGLFWYPFQSLSCSLMTAVTGKKNHKARKLLKQLGFHPTEPIPLLFDGEEAGVPHYMTRDQCKWLEGSNEQRLDSRARAA